MKRKVFYFSMLLFAALMVTSCQKEDNNNKSMVDGTYIHQTHSAYKIVVQGNSWTSIINNANYGKGTYTLSGNNSVSGRSTYAWDNGQWVSYTDDTFSGTYDEESSSFTITSTGYDTNFNGTYLHNLFTDIVTSNYTATGTPGFLTNPGPSSWTGQVAPSTGQDQFYTISGWGGTTIDVYCDFKDGRIVMDNYSKVVTDNSNHEGYFQALAVNTNTKTYYVITDDYGVKYNKTTKTMDFSGTYNELPVYVGVVGKNVGSDTIEGYFTDMYANAKLTLTSTPKLSGDAPKKTMAFSSSASISLKELKNYKMGGKL